jgi:hypothetical protein
MADTFIEGPAEPASDRFQVIAAIVLGIAATLTAFSAYKAALADGDALQGYTNSTATLSDANFFYSQANQTSAGDQELFVSYATANFEGNAELADYLQTLMRPELSEAVDWWNTSDEAETPFDDIEGNPYTVEDLDTAKELEDQAAAEFDEGAEADDNGDKFELAAVFFALTLFFGGIATLFRQRSVTAALLIVSGVTLLVGAVNLANAL